MKFKFRFKNRKIKFREADYIEKHYLKDGKAVIPIHLNSISSSTWRGAQVFYDDINEKNIEIANLFQEQLKKDLKTTRKVKQISTMLMNRKIKIPGILIEAGFLSNPNDRYLLRQDDYQYKICNSIRNGLIKYFKYSFTIL